MKIDRIQLSKIKAQYEILKMTAAYIEAEKAIMQNPGLTQWQEPHTKVNMDPQDEWFSLLEDTHRPVSADAKSTERALIKAQMLELEETGRKLLAEEKYELMREAQEIYEKLKQQLKNLK